MSEFKAFAAAFCTVCTATGGLYILTPKRVCEKSVRYIFSLIILLGILTALPQLRKISLKPQDSSYTITESDEASVQAAQRVFETALSNNGIKYEKISLLTDKTEDGRIKIIKVTVVASEQLEDIRNILGGDNAEYKIEIIS